jgi:hypothetical protein
VCPDSMFNERVHEPHRRRWRRKGSGTGAFRRPITRCFHGWVRLRRPERSSRRRIDAAPLLLGHGAGLFGQGPSPPCLQPGPVALWQKGAQAMGDVGPVQPHERPECARRASCDGACERSECVYMLASIREELGERYLSYIGGWREEERERESRGRQ